MKPVTLALAVCALVLLAPLRAPMAAQPVQLELFRFPNDDTLLDDMLVYTPDAHGGFTHRVERVGNDWKMPELNGMVLTTDRKSTRLNSSHIQKSRMPSSA